MTMTTEEWNERTARLGAEIRETLTRGIPAYVRWTPMNGTAYNLLFTPSWITCAVAPGGLADAVMFPPDEGVVYLSSDSGTYPWNWDHAPHVDYVAEKWARGRSADGAALVLLLAAISETEPTCSFADADIYVRDEASA